MDLLPMLPEALREQLRTTRSLPSPPAITARLIQLCEDPDVGINDVVDLLSSDAVLTAKLLRLANSPLYARKRCIDNLRQAVALLGVDAVLTASLSLTMQSHRTIAVGPARCRAQRYWTRSVHAAAVAQLFGDGRADVRPCDAFLVALLQDIGMYAMDRLFPNLYADDVSTHCHAVRCEIEQLGVDHAELGGELLSEWNLPPAVVEAVRDSHRGGDPETCTLAALAFVGGLVADGIAGDFGALELARDVARQRLLIDDVDFAAAFVQLEPVLAELAVVLDAAVPDPETLAELAEDVLVARHLEHHRTTARLNHEITTLSEVADRHRRDAQRDPLTGVLNRRAFDELVRDKFGYATRDAQPMSVLFLDLDDFKTTNDRYGHLGGDEVLIETARRIVATVRDDDTVGRYGGEEFVVILPGTGAAAAEVVARRIIQHLTHQPFRLVDGRSFTQTASIGIATALSGRYPDVAAMLRAADTSLYRAKRDGKNCFRACDGSEQPCHPATTSAGA